MLRGNAGAVSAGMVGDSEVCRRQEIMTKVVIRTDDTAGFSARAKDAARRADRGQPFDGKVTLSFEDPKRMFAVLSEA